MQKIHKAKQLISNWSGGTTTELFIFPQDAEYAKRNFLFRISTATVETETSTFTSLPNYNRILMVLNGLLTITHKHHYSKQLTQFETDTFNGAWQTSAIGKVTDFNIMFAEGITANIVAHKVLPETPLQFSANKTYCFGYVVSGNATIKNASATTKIVSNDFILLNKNEDYYLTTQHSCDWLLIEISA